MKRWGMYQVVEQFLGSTDGIAVVSLQLFSSLVQCHDGGGLSQSEARLGSCQH